MKRAADQLALVPSKKSRQELVAAGGRTVLNYDGPRRTSTLTSPIMLLTGHQGEIFAAKFHPEGHFLASAGFDRQIFLWNTLGECENLGVMSGHSGAVMELSFSTDGATIYSASTDKTIGLWDIEYGSLVKRLKGHLTFVNAVHNARRGPQQLCSGSDDCTVKLWDARKRNATMTLNNVYQVTAVSFSDTAEQLITGGIDNDIKVWDLRKGSVLYKMKGHTDTVTGLNLSPDGSYILSNAMDNTLRIWDIRPYAPSERCVKIMSGHMHNFEKNLLRCAWAPDGSKVMSGSADKHVYIWDTTSRRILYKLPGHAASVNDVDFHSKQPIILSASSDKQIYLGEIE